jgi:hypothetical protein
MLAVLILIHARRLEARSKAARLDEAVAAFDAGLQSLDHLVCNMVQDIRNGHGWGS